ncbi:MAG: hypothetical protein ACI8QS_002361 [Planctomycetota bacterium]|jgi:hypothetical protein
MVLLALAVLNMIFVRDDLAETQVEQLFPGLKPELARRIQITAPGGETASLVLDDEGLWTVEERFGWRAYQPAVDSLLRGLSGAKTSEREATSSSSHAALGVDAETANHIRVGGADGELLADLLQGSPPENRRGSRVLVVGQDSVYRTANVPRVVPDPSRLIDSDLLSLDANEVQSITLQLRITGSVRQDAVTLGRRDDGRFDLIDSERSLPPAAVSPFLGGLESLVAKDVVAGPELDVAGPGVAAALVVQFELGGGQAGSIAIGYEDPFGVPPPQEGAVYAAVGGVGAEPGQLVWFALPVSSANRLLGLANELLQRTL